MKKHSHNYEHSHIHHNENETSKNILIALVLNLIFVFIEIAGGIFSNSMSIISDAVHDFGDTLALLFTLILSKLSLKGRDHNYTYGYKRVTVLGALINSIILISGSLFIYTRAFERWQNPEPIRADIMLVLAIIGIVVNGYSAFRMRKTKSLMDKSIMLHLLEDLLGWVAVLISSILIILFEIYRVDVLLSFGISTYILINSVRNLKGAIEILLQKVPLNIDVEKVEKEIKQINNVKDVHDVHIWTLDGTDIVLTAHVVVEGGIDISDRQEIKKEIKDQLEKIEINHATLELETKQEAIKHGEINI